MIHLTPFAISGILIVVFYLPLFLFVAVKGKTKTAFVFSLYLFCVFLWGIGVFLFGINRDMDPAVSLFIWKLVYIAVLFIPVFFLHSVLLMINKPYRLLLLLTYLQAFIFSILTLKGYLTSAPPHLIFDSFYVWAGGRTYYVSFLIWAIVSSLAHILLTLYYKHTHPQQKKQIFCLMLAVIGWLGGLTNFLLATDISIPFYPYGNFLIPIHSIIVTYAILKHQLLDIVVAIKRSLVYSFLIALITGIYLIIVILSEKILQGIIRYQSVPVSLAAAFILGIVFIPLRNRIQDIVDRLFFQKSPLELAQQNQRLLKEVARSEQLKIAATMAGGIAHEIKNPLTTISTFIEHLPKGKDDPEFMARFNRIVGGEVKRVNSLANQLMDFAKPSLPHLQKIDIHLLIDELLDFLSNQLSAHHVRLIKEYHSKVQVILSIDPMQIKQALLNLLLNAIDATGDQGTISVKTVVEDTFFEITICDTGCGITPQDLPHIFEPFFSKKTKGTGLGLSITHEIIEKHKGNIRVESKAGEGTKFVIGIPVENLNSTC